MSDEIATLRAALANVAYELSYSDEGCIDLVEWRLDVADAVLAELPRHAEAILHLVGDVREGRFYADATYRSYGNPPSDHEGRPCFVVVPRGVET